VADRVLERWRDAKLPALDEHRARIAIRRRVAGGTSAAELLEAVDGARARSDSEGWTGVCSAFAVVMASAEDVSAYARRGREKRAASERRSDAAKEARARERATEQMATLGRVALAESIAAAARGEYKVAARLARELEGEGGQGERARAIGGGRRQTVGETPDAV
jgi:hypothetical protein